MATVKSVNISVEKGTQKSPVDEIVINELGVVGDGHSGSWHRQVSLLAAESVAKLAETSGREIRPGEFAENITTQGVDLAQVAVFDLLKIGEVELEVTQIGKKCHGQECVIFREIGDCVMPREGIFCRVIKGGGRVKAGDGIIYEAKPLRVMILTVSDRAARGEYQDRSGPAVREGLEKFFANQRWQLEFETLVIPDEEEQIRGNLEKGCDDGFNLIFTTGGTGISPRDITPEVVSGVIDKEIPGIMEFVRVKYGEKIPNALLSRSIAGCRKTTLIYALPGSVKAVNEYLAEITRTIEHSIFMINGLDAH